jgi:hypothetical protein
VAAEARNSGVCGLQGLQPGTAANSNLPPHTGEHLDHRLPALGGNVISLVVPGCAAAQEYPRPPDEFKREYLHLVSFTLYQDSVAVIRSQTNNYRTPRQFEHYWVSCGDS